MKIRWKELILSLIMAIGLWYSVSGSEKIETQIEVRVDYRGIPSNLAISEGIISKVKVRVKASAGQIATLYNRDSPAFLMDLSGLVKGENILPIPISKFPFWGGVEVIDVVPSNIILEVDAVKSKKVPLTIDLVNLTKNQKKELSVSVEPSVVTIKGPEEMIDALSSLAVRCPVLTSGDSHYLKVAVSTPDNVDAQPMQVNLTIRPASEERNE